MAEFIPQLKNKAKAKIVRIFFIVLLWFSSLPAVAMEPLSTDIKKIVSKYFCYRPWLSAAEKKELEQYIKQQPQRRWQRIQLTLQSPDKFIIYGHDGVPLTNKQSVELLCSQLSQVRIRYIEEVMQKLPFHDGFFGQQKYLYATEIEEIIGQYKKEKNE
jgi:hypothetical protein